MVGLGTVHLEKPLALEGVQCWPSGAPNLWLPYWSKNELHLIIVGVHIAHVTLLHSNHIVMVSQRAYDMDLGQQYCIVLHPRTCQGGRNATLLCYHCLATSLIHPTRYVDGCGCVRSCSFVDHDFEDNILATSTVSNKISDMPTHNASPKGSVVACFLPSPVHTLNIVSIREDPCVHRCYFWFWIFPHAKIEVTKVKSMLWPEVVVAARGYGCSKKLERLWQEVDAIICQKLGTKGCDKRFWDQCSCQNRKIVRSMLR